VEVQVSGRKVQLSPALRQAVETKLGRLERFLRGEHRAEVVFLEERNGRIADKRDVCEVLIDGAGHHLRARVAAPDPFAAIDAAVTKLEHQLHKAKSRVHGKGAGRRRPAPGPAEA
jgi:ribosomal subunit interface protein